MGLSTSDCLYVKRISVRVPYLHEASSTRALPLCSGFPIGMGPSYQKDLCAKGVHKGVASGPVPPPYEVKRRETKKSTQTRAHPKKLWAKSDVFSFFWWGYLGAHRGL